MMKRPKTKLPELLTALNFPRNGEIVGGVQVIKAKATMDDDILKYEVHFPKGTKAKQVPTLLRQFYSTQVIPGKAGLVVRHHDYSVGPKEGNVAVVGAMHIIPVVRANPGIQEFDQEYSKMEMKNPETFFRVFPYKGFNSPQFRAKLFSFVGFIGENYGYCDGKNIYHRRASLVMPKIKITKAIPHAKMMYHTHPSKDEPSLSSPDDYLLYMDLSHAPRSIRHFMTVMKDRMDHFQITPKKGSKANFLKLQEDKILEEIDAKIGELEKKWDAKTPVKDGVPKKEQHAANLEFCENITRDLVKWMNTKYGKFFSFKYNCYYRVRKNPDGPTADNLHLDDEFLQKAIGDINSRRYSWPEFRTSDMPHESYAYWHQQYYKHHVKDSAMTLGVTPQGGDKRVYERFMSQSFEGSTLSNQDALNVLNVAYDIAKHDSKIRDGGELQSRMDDLASYLQLTDEARETLVMLEHVLHNEDVFSETAQTMAGDYYPLILLSKYSISAIEAIDQVKAGKLDLEMAKVKVYVNLKRRTSDALLGFLYRNNERGNFVDSYLNPPSIRFQRVDMASQIPPEALEYYDIAAEALGEFSAARYDSKSPFFTARNKFNLRVPTKNGMVTVMIPQRTGTVELKTSSAEPMEAAMEAMDKIGAALYRAGLPVDPEEFNVTTLDAAVNPAPQVIAICGPSGSGKSTTIRNLLRELPNSKTVPTYTTRQKRASDKEGERVFVTEEQFKRHLRAGDMVTAKLQKNGNYYGRMLSDFSNADYVIVDVTLSGLNELRRAFPNTFSVYLEPVEDPKYIQKRLLRRGDMSPQEARKRAEIIPSHIESSKAMNFDVRVQTKQGQFDYAAREVLSALPKANPQPTLDDFGFEEVTADATKADLTKIGKKRVKGPRIEDQVPQSGELTPGQMTLIEAIRAVTGEEEVKENPVRRADPVDLERFTKWVKLVNMKNKELKEFLDSDLGKKAGLNKKRQKEFGGINRGRTSGLAILRMRGKLGLTGPKDYIKNGPRIIEGYYNMALEKWNETDWYWCGRQISFNSRARGQRGPYTDNKGRPTRKLLALWVWGHDPWRYARKIEGKERMPPCPNVPWVGMTEKRKYGTTEFVYKNPAFVVGKPTEHSFQLRIEPDDADPIKLEALRAATDKSFKHHKWYVIHHLDYVMKIAHALKPRAQPDEKEIINDIVWMHDYPKMMGDKDNYELVRELVAKHKGKDYADELVGYLEDMEMIKAVDSMYGVETTIFALIMSTADALAHYYGPFFQIFHDENPDLTIAELKKKNQEKLEKDKRKLRAGPMEGALDGIKFRYKGRKIKVTGNEHIAELIERSNPRRTPGGKTIPKRYLKGLTKEEMQIAIKEIDKGYKYDIDDPEAYEYWKSDIKATARGYKPVPSKYKKKFIKMYGPLPETGDFLTKMSKATGIKKSILQKVYDKGLAAWRTGHRPGVQQHQWAAGRVYSFVTLGNTVMKGKKKMGDYSLAVEAGLIKENPPKISHYPDPDPESPKGMQRIDLHEEEKNIGYLLWYREGGKTWIHYINVSKDHRGKRLGRLLISELLAKTKGEEIHLHAPIGAPREHLVQWYESMGFNLLEGDTNEMVLQNPSTADFFPGDADVAHPYMTAQTIPITALQNGGEWRHGEFAEDDPFDEYF